jgi:lipopolysaccharide export system protein LptA
MQNKKLRSMKSLAPSIFAAAALLAIAAPASAQLAKGQDGPIDITADEFEVVQSSCRSTWTGNAEALQGDARLRASTLRAFMQPKASGKPGSTENSCGDLLRLEAEGSVYYVTPQQRVRGDAAVYDATTETIVMTGDVVAVQDQNVLRGARMVFNSKTGEGKMTGSSRGKNAAGRPRAVLYPSKKTTP